MELHRGRLIDHIQLMVKDIEANKRFYKAVIEVLDPDGNSIEIVFRGPAKNSER